jgi:hypothetical protein
LNSFIKEGNKVKSSKSIRYCFHTHILLKLSLVYKFFNYYCHCSLFFLHSFAQQKFNESTSPIPIQTRQSRVMHFEDKTKAFRQVVNKDQLAKLKEQRLPPVEHVNMANGGSGSRRRMYQNMPLRKNLEMKSKAIIISNNLFLSPSSSFSSSSPIARARTDCCNFHLCTFADGKRMKITAVHYDGDSSKLEETRHHSYRGN